MGKICQPAIFSWYKTNHQQLKNSPDSEKNPGFLVKTISLLRPADAEKQTCPLERLPLPAERGNDSALIETLLKVKMDRSNSKPNSIVKTNEWRSLSVI